MRSPYAYPLLALWLCVILPVSEVFGQSPSVDTGNTEVVAQAALAAVAAPDAPYYISYQGFLEDGGSPANGTYSIQFRFMNQASLGSALWTETHPAVQVTDGIFNVLFGTISTLATEDFDDDLWLSVKVNGSNELLPRPRIVGTPYSFLAFEALDLRLPAEITGATQLQGQEILKITQTGLAGDVLHIDGGGAASTGILVTGVDLTGISVSSEFASGIFSSGVTGVAADASGDAFVATSPGDDGLQVTSAGDDGIHIVNAGDDGIYVQNATDAGIFVDGVGGYAFDFRDVPVSSAGGNLNAYVGRVENTSTGTSSDALAVQIETPGNPGTAANFVGFFDGDNQLIGQIEGNGAGGVAYNTSGADYAEYLPQLRLDEVFYDGDVVGVFNGHITRRTKGAHQIMAISDRPAVLGNAPTGMDDAPDHQAVSFIGQVRVRVEGPVNEGDYIVASGRDDGLGVAVSAKAITLDHVSSLVGRAWESSANPGIHSVNIVVGLDRTEVLETVIRRQDAQLERQRQTLDELRRVLEAHVREYVGASSIDESSPASR